MSKQLQLAVVLRAIDMMSGPLRGAMRAMDGLTASAEKFRAVGARMKEVGQASAVAGAAVTAAVAAPIAAYAKLEDSMVRAKSAFMTGGGIDTGFAKVEALAIRLGNQLPGSTSDFLAMAAAMRELGIETRTISGGALEAAANLKVLLNLGGEEAADLTATFSRSLGVLPNDIVKFVDQLQRAKGAFGLDPSQFGYTLKYVGPSLKALGLQGFESAKEVLALSGALSQAGIRGEQLGTSLRFALNSLPEMGEKLRSNEQLRSILGGAGISLKFFDGKGQFLGIQNMLAELEKLNVLSPQKKLTALSEMFGSEAGSAMAEASSIGLKGYSNAVKAMESQASLQQRITLVLDSLMSKWDAATGTVTNALAIFGSAMGEDLKRLADWLNKAAEATGNFLRGHSTITRVIGLAALTFGGLALAVGAVLIPLGSFFQLIAWSAGGFGAATKAMTIVAGVLRAQVIPAIVSATSASWAWVAAMLANPVVQLALGVAAAVAVVAGAAYLIYRNWGEITAFLSRVWNAIYEAGARMFRAGANLITMLWQGMKSVASRPVQMIADVVQRVRAYLPFSPAKVGPLRDLHRVKLVETFASAIKPGPVTAAMGRVAQAAAPRPGLLGSARGASPAGRAGEGVGPSVHVSLSYGNITVGGAGGAAARDEWLRMLRDHGDQVAREVSRVLDLRARGAFAT